LQEFYNDFSEENKKIFESDSNYMKNIDDIYNLIAKNKDSFKPDKKKLVDDLLFVKDASNKDIKLLYSINSKYDTKLISSLRGLGEDVGAISDKNKEITNIAEQKGITAIYSFRNYGGDVNISEAKDLFDNLEGGNREVSSTYREKSIDERKKLANSEDSTIREQYRLLTQLAFDSGKMGDKECKEIMGKKCEKCVIYKFLCCQDNPNSPYCKK